MRKVVIACFSLLAAVQPSVAGSAPHPYSSVRSCPGQARLRSSRTSYVALVRRATTAYRSPGHHAFHRFGRRNVNRVRTVFLIRSARFNHNCQPTWFGVMLPIRPNGTVGYIRARTVVVATVHTRIVVSLSRRRLRLFKYGRPILQTRTAIGAPRTPTPKGRFYINQRLRADAPAGPWGPAALGISAFSPVLTWWPQGGPIAIHGTNRPDLIGRAVSAGCIRVRNRMVLRLFRLVPTGTPVNIRR